MVQFSFVDDGQGNRRNSRAFGSKNFYFGLNGRSHTTKKNQKEPLTNKAKELAIFQNLEY
jgi:hypothetical protein